MQLKIDTHAPEPVNTARPRLGFVGLGWIGRHRMQAICEQGGVDIVALADPSDECVAEAAALAPGAATGNTLQDVLAAKPDGVVIATPSAMHAAQTIEALEAGCAVFCQKPLGRNEAEARAAVDAARKADRLLSVDLSYRGTKALNAIRDRVRAGDLGRVFAMDLVFHNAYGPDKPWFYDKAQSGGGPLMDLGVHLVDSALWCLDFPAIVDVRGRVYRGGDPAVPQTEVEDYATATLTTDTGVTINIACSWKLNAGHEAEIAAHVHGTQAGASLTNPGHGFYDFAAHLHRGTATDELVAPPDAWGGVMAQAWARQLAQNPRFDPEAERLVSLSQTIDRIYAAAR
ncbi:Gfo/Idh/MocA family protein [Falsirhodobacter deserti]|uniref:Gfo/Idh/MocA family protein n=1 Tax=Falsirhodobacter deserti TaxID=1365611 RepID=UPI000FE386EE|nr:Gfo/Idh/MocA family oxidoreductase [Falsirhodobacter deserti]